MRPIFQLGGFLSAAAGRVPERPCILFPDGSERSFREVEQRVVKLGDALSRHGVAKGDRVAMLAVDSAGYVESLYACAMIGAVFVPLNNRLRTPEVATLLRAAEPAILFVSARYAAMAKEIQPQLPTLRLVICYDGSEGLIDYEQFLASGDDVRHDAMLTDEDISAIAYTSGTTGLPKGVLQSHGMLKRYFSAGLYNFELDRDSSNYSGSPLFHIAGYGMVMTHLISRSASLIMPQFDPGEVLKCIDRGNIHCCLFVPTMITMLLDHPDCATTSFKGLDRILYGAAPMSPALLARAMDVFQCDFVQLFGAGTEGGTQLTLTSEDHRRARQGETHLLASVGRPAIGVRMRIADRDGNEVPRGEIGDIITISDQTMSGYLGMPEESARALRDGWFWGGDMGRMDEEGYVYLAGRSKDMIIRGGENIYPLEIETVIERLPGVRTVSVIGEPDDHWGEIVVACVIVDDAFEGVENLLRVCDTNLAKYKLPARVEILDSMPLTGSAKVSKPELRALGQHGRAETLARKIPAEPFGR